MSLYTQVKKAVSKAYEPAYGQLSQQEQQLKEQVEKSQQTIAQKRLRAGQYAQQITSQTALRREGLQALPQRKLALGQVESVKGQLGEAEKQLVQQQAQFSQQIATERERLLKEQEETFKKELKSAEFQAAKESAGGRYTVYGTKQFGGETVTDYSKPIGYVKGSDPNILYGYKGGEYGVGQIGSWVPKDITPEELAHLGGDYKPGDFVPVTTSITTIAAQRLEQPKISGGSKVREINIQLPYQTRGTIGEQRTEFQQEYEPYKFGITDVSKGIQAGVTKVATTTGAGWEQLLTDVGYKGIPLTTPPKPETISPIQLPYQTRGTIGEQRKDIIPATEGGTNYLLQPKAVGKAITLGVELGAYSVPYLGNTLMASHLPTFYETLTTPIPKLSELQIIPEARPEGITDTEWQSYLSEVEAYNKAQEKYVKSLKTQRIMAGVGLGVSAGFLVYKGYKAVTKPIIIAAKPKPPVSFGRAEVISLGERGVSKVQIATITPGRIYIKTTPIKEALFWGTGKRIDLAVKSITPAKLTLTQATLISTPKAARGIGSGVRVGDITRKTVTIPVRDVQTLYGQFAQPGLKVDYFALMKKAPPKTIKPFELQAVRAPVTGKLPPVEQKIFREIARKTTEPGLRIVKPEFIYFRAGVKKIEGIPIGKEGWRITKVGKVNEFSLIKPSVDKSIQVMKVAKKPYRWAELPKGKIEWYETYTGAKGFTGRLPVTRGRIDVIPISVKVTYPSTSPSITFIETGTKIKTVKTIKDFITPTESATQTLTKQSSKAITEQTKKIQEQVQKISEATSVLAKNRAIPVPVVATKTTQIPFVSSASVLSLIQPVAQKVIEVPKLEIAQKEVTILKEIPKMETATSSGQVEVSSQTFLQAVKVIEVPKLETPTLTISAPSPRAPSPKPIVPPPQITPPFIPVLEEEDVKIKRKILKKKRLELFIPFVRRKGKFMPIAQPTTKERALKVGLAKVRGTLGASLQIRTTTGKAIVFGKPIKSEFRFGKAGKEPTILVQRAPRRLSARGERAEIIASRKAGRVKFI